MSLIEGFKIFKNGVENWFEVAIKMLILKKESECRIKNIGSVKLKKGKNYLNSSLFRAVIHSNTKELNNDQIDILKTYLPQIDNEIVTIINYEDNKKFKFTNNEISIIFERFLFEEYKEIPYSNDNEYLIDVGANVGDSAIYFANKGYNVIALEPLPHICDIARKNIELNPDIKDQITFINKACSCKKGYTEINFNADDTAGANEYLPSNEKIKVETITIEDIIKEYDIKPSILKIDCEGCEVNVIKHSDLSMFKKIIFEYHTNITGVDENILVDILKKQNFKVVNQIKFKQDNVGIIYMEK